MARRDGPDAPDFSNTPDFVAPSFDVDTEDESDLTEEAARRHPEQRRRMDEHADDLEPLESEELVTDAIQYFSDDPDGDDEPLVTGHQDGNTDRPRGR